MNKRSESGSVVTIVIIIALVLALMAVSALAFWAYTSQQDYKNNSDQKVAKAVSAATAAQKAQLEAQFAEESKNPNQTYRGSSTYGSITFKYPKTWSAYVDETDQNEPINGYFYPGAVPGVSGSTAFALRVELVSNAYDQVLQEFDVAGNAGKLTAVAYVPPKMKNVANVQPGTMFSGNIGLDQQGNPVNGQMLVIKVRDKTLKIYTQSKNFSADFNKTVLPSLTFVP